MCIRDSIRTTWTTSTRTVTVQEASKTVAAAVAGIKKEQKTAVKKVGVAQKAKGKASVVPKKVVKASAAVKKAVVSSHK